jgi:antitoxin PrlF
VSRRSVLTILTAKGQVTIPVEVRRYLGLEPNDKVAFVIEDGDVRVRRHGSVVERTAGILRRAGQPGLTAAEMREGVSTMIANDADFRKR